MFGKKRNREIARLQHEFSALKHHEQAERNRADALAGEVARLQAENTRLLSQGTLFSGLTEPLNQFGDSVKALQASLAVMSQSMKNETREAIHNLEETSLSQKFVQKLTERITQLIDRAHQSTEAIGQLHERTGQINGIVKLIKGIADQTNLLALNAAIEASGPVSKAGGSQWLRMKLESWRSAPLPLPMKYPDWSRACSRKLQHSSKLQKSIPRR